MYFSFVVMAEYEEVLRRARLDIHPEKVTNALARIREAGLAVNPAVPVTVASDPDDNIFLECAGIRGADHGCAASTKLKFEDEVKPPAELGSISSWSCVDAVRRRA